MHSLSTGANHLGFTKPSHPVACYYDAIIFWKQLRCVVIETPTVIAMVYLCIQMIKGSQLCLAEMSTSGVQDPDFGLQSARILGIFRIRNGCRFPFNGIRIRIIQMSHTVAIKIFDMEL